MRFLGIVSILAAGSWLAACGDGDAGAIVREDISWKISGQGVHAGHTQMNVDQKFKVACSRTSAGMNIRIEDPGQPAKAGQGVAGAARPGGAIIITNGNPTTGTCNITVDDAESYGAFAIKYGGSCPTDCTFAGQFGAGGWDFSGTIRCAGLKKVATGDANNYGLISAATSVEVLLNVDNCD
jgi:hypothetical protein